jgi:hypothetical protein
METSGDAIIDPSPELLRSEIRARAAELRALRRLLKLADAAREAKDALGGKGQDQDVSQRQVTRAR